MSNLEVNLSFSCHRLLEIISEYKIFSDKLRHDIKNYQYKYLNIFYRCKIDIGYKTSPDSTALQWLTAEQTAGGIHPYLFSQCEVKT